MCSLGVSLRIGTSAQLTSWELTVYVGIVKTSVKTDRECWQQLGVSRLNNTAEILVSNFVEIVVEHCNLSLRS